MYYFVHVHKSNYKFNLYSNTSYFIVVSVKYLLLKNIYTLHDYYQTNLVTNLLLNQKKSATKALKPQENRRFNKQSRMLKKKLIIQLQITYILKHLSSERHYFTKKNKDKWMRPGYIYVSNILLVIPVSRNLSFKILMS